MSSSTALAWLTLGVEDVGRFLWQRGAHLPFPLQNSSLGRWDLPVEELIGDVPPRPVPVDRAQQRLLDSLAEILRAPAYSASVTRVEGGSTLDVAAVAGGGGEVILFVDPGDGQVQLSRVSDTEIAVTVAAQLPRLLGAPMTTVRLPGQTAALLASGSQREVPERTLRSAMTSAGIPEDLATRLLAAGEGTARGNVTAVAYDQNPPTISPACASWTEMRDGGMISTQLRSGEVVVEPLSTAAVARAVAAALTALSPG